MIISRDNLRERVEAQVNTTALQPVTTAARDIASILASYNVNSYTQTIQRDLSVVTIDLHGGDLTITVRLR